MGSVLVQEDADEDDQAHCEDGREDVANLTLRSVRDVDEAKKKSSTQVEVDFVRSTRQNLEVDA
jgi:hypothetical protein